MNVHISCSKECQFEMNWDGTTIQEVEIYYKNWNLFYKGRMTCVHDYVIEENQ